MDQQRSEQEQQHITSIEPNILEISEEDFRVVFGSSDDWSGYTFVPSANNPHIAGSWYDKQGHHVAISIGDCRYGPC
jgi:hypothetical protein